MSEEVKPLTEDELQEVRDVVARGHCMNLHAVYPTMSRLLATISALEKQRRTPGTTEVCARCGRNVIDALEKCGWYVSKAEDCPLRPHHIKG